MWKAFLTTAAAVFLVSVCGPARGDLVQVNAVIGDEVGGGGTAFSSGELGWGENNPGNLNDGSRVGDPTGTWIASTADSQFGITLAGPITIGGVGWQNAFGNRSVGTYQVQYTTDNTIWSTVGTDAYTVADTGRRFYEFDPVENVTAMRVNVTDSPLEVSIAEFQVFEGVTNPTKAGALLMTEVGQLGTAFSSGDLVWGENNAGNLNDRNWAPDPTGTWIADVADSHFGITLAEPTTVTHLAWKNAFGNREIGEYQVQYTTDGVQWNTIGTVNKGASLTRNVFRFDAIEGVTGMRVTVSDAVAQIAIQELEVYSDGVAPNHLTIIETGGALESGMTEGAMDLALSANGAVAFAASEVSNGNYPAADIIDGIYGEPNSWVALDVFEGGSIDSWVGVALAEPAAIDRIAFSQDNDIGGDGPNPYLRTPAIVELQYTTDDRASLLSDPGGATWASIGAVALADSNDQLRKLLQFDPMADVTGVRLVLTGGDGSSPLMDELEVYAVPEPGALVMLVGGGLLGLLLWWRRRRAA